MSNVLDQYREKPPITLTDEKLLVPDFRGVPRELPSVGIFDEPTRCYRLNKEWAKIVMGWVSWLATVAAWPEATDEDYTGITEILKFKVGENCMPFQLRQSPTDSCILEQTLDGGETWLPVFDFSLCDSIVDDSETVIYVNSSVEFFNNVFQEIYNNFVTNYVDSPTDIHAELGYGLGNDAELDAAYCNAVYVLVSVSCDMAIDAITSLNEQQSQFNFFLSMAAFVMTGIAIAGALPSAGLSLVALASLATWWAPVIGITGALANSLLDRYQASTIEQYADQAAQFEVTCWIVDNLPGDDNTYADMLALLQGHDLEDNAGVIADHLAALLEANATYAAFLEKWNNNLEYAQVGIELFCPCGEECIEYDFTTSDHGFVVWTTTGTAARPFGVWVDGVGWQCTYDDSPGPGQGFDNRIYIEKLDMSLTWDSIRYEMDYIAKAGTPNANIMGMQAETNQTIGMFSGLVVDSTERTAEVALADNDNDGLRFLVVTNTAAAEDQDAFTLVRLRVYYFQGPPDGGSECP